MDTLVLVLHFQRFFGEASAITDITLHIDCRQEVHLHRDKTIALTGLTTTTRPVERETTGFPTTYARFFAGGKEVANMTKGAGIGGRIGARSTTDRTLIDEHHPR